VTPQDDIREAINVLAVLKDESSKGWHRVACERAKGKLLHALQLMKETEDERQRTQVG
jgi:hypothetical protein